jgi:serine/threonine protein kinase/Flp pilus assembly protein TadD
LSSRQQLDKLLDEFEAVWSRGDRPRAEDYVGRLALPEDAVALIYHEFCLAEAAGEKPVPDVFLRRFPAHGKALARLLGLHEAISAEHLRLWTEPADVPLPESGDSIGSYRLLRELGRGSFARVFLAEEGDLARRLVVVKVSRRASPEPQLLARARHPNIVEVMRRAQTDDGSLHIVCMPYLGGATLSQVLAELRHGKRGTPPRRGRDLLLALDRVAEPEESESSRHGAARQVIQRLNYSQSVAWILARLAEGLDTAHRRGVLHGDLKPSNVLVTADGRPMLLDFNLAVEWERQPTSDAGGTLAYMSPERLRALADRAGPGATVVRAPIVGPLARRRADLYALGLILCESLRLEIEAPCPPGRETPPGSPTQAARSLAITRSNPDWVRRQITHRRIPTDLRPILRRCLAPEPEDRYTRAGELAEDLDRFVANRAPVFAKHSSAKAQVARWLRRHRVAATLIGLVTLVGGLATGISWLHVDGSQRRAAIEKLDRLWEGREPGVFRLHRIGLSRENELAVRGQFAQRHLAEYGVLEAADWRDRSDVRSLPPSERFDLELWLCEQTWRYARSLGDRADSPGDWQRAIAVLDHDAVWSHLPVVVTLRGRIAARLGGPAPRIESGAPPIAPGLLAYSEALAAEEADRNQARALYERVLSLHPESFWASYRAAVQAYRRGYNVEAVKYMTKCTEMRPRNPLLHTQLAGCLFRLGRNVEAQWHCDQAVSIDPDLDGAYHTRFFVRPRLGQTQGFDADLKRFSVLSERASAGFAPLGSTDDAGPTQELLDDDRAQSAIEFWLMRAMAWERARRFDEALELLEKILKIDPDHLLARYILGVAYLGQGRREEAIAEFGAVARDARFEEMIREDAKFLQLYGFAFRECLRRGRNADAIAFAELGLAMARKLDARLEIARTQRWLASALAADAKPGGEVFERIVRLLLQSRAVNPELFGNYYSNDEYLASLRPALDARLSTQSSAEETEWMPPTKPCP